jgi:hypothetical protein
MTDYEYKATDSGTNGKTFERDLKAFFGQRAVVSKQGKIDFRRARVCFEVKTGAGELDYLLHSKVKYVVYVPVVRMNQPIERQEGFILNRETFLAILDEVGLIRSKVSTSGQVKTTIQTFWNNSKGKAHGKKYFALLDRLYEDSLVTFDQFLEDGGKLEG